MKRKWHVFLGASVIAGALGLFLRKEEAASEDPSLLYVGSWSFFHPKEAKNHILTIYPDLSIMIDGKEIVYQLIELTKNKLTIQDQFGYHLVIKTEKGVPTTLYDEADDASLPISPVN
ncbi:DUF4828 domain-containing protein [Enterococcus pallens]|uniref:DUF4828 domain-containing protein n=1 Tax=Enterococcus pallens ATCC BAA-351 TaxID=1158607 RepID=R2RWX9_9ENTE|nr:DUF4828 domain-containing protein [Enterococcus pallens]EOH87815.1 hypothetical protein UAU_04670 [Enterococcus pallens ATCC BAA-351]EOU18029.1 hypothetical protein I588_03018 [Enterococcus pallens ATCC BAA-351]OJG82347.1 hypothetical protein RV10_GL000168 [Enterococcus pallens]